MKFILRTLYSMIFIFLLFIQTLQSQDTLSTTKPPLYASFGFQASFVSGIGLSYGEMINDRAQVKGSGGMISSDGKSLFAIGFDYNYAISTQPHMRIFVGPSIGVYGGSHEAPKHRIGLGTGIEVPITGNTVFQNITVGAVVYYPTFFVYSRSISFAGSLFLLYNF